MSPLIAIELDQRENGSTAGTVIIGKSRWKRDPRKMLDALMLAIGGAFLVVAVIYTIACDRI